MHVQGVLRVLKFNLFLRAIVHTTPYISVKYVGGLAGVTQEEQGHKELKPMCVTGFPLPSCCGARVVREGFARTVPS